MTMRRIGAAIVAAAMLGGLALATTPAGAAPADPVVQLTSEQLTEGGFTKRPNTVAWEPGTAVLGTNSAEQWEDVVITGKAPGYTQPGQLLTMQRFLPSDTQGSGTFKSLNITAVVRPDRTYTMHFQLGFPGTYGYRVGYSTGGDTPEFVGFQFQFTTTGSGKAAPTTGSQTTVTLTAKQLTRGGFTRTPNTVAWQPGTATLSTNRAPAGAPVTIAGTAPSFVKPGTTLTLNRFVPTDKLGSGHFEPVGHVATVVKADGTFDLTFELNQPGRYGYSLGAVQGEEWVGVEFQLKTT
jgi:hypothetical protein